MHFAATNLIFNKKIGRNKNNKFRQIWGQAKSNGWKQDADDALSQASIAQSCPQHHAQHFFYKHYA